MLKTLKFGLILLVFLSPLVYWGSTMYPYLTLKVVIFQSLVEILFAIWLTLIIFHKEYRPKWTPLSIILLLLITLLFISSFFGADFHRSFWSAQSRLTGLFLLLHLTALFFMLTAAPVSWRMIWWAGLAVSVASSVLSFVEKFFITDIFHSNDPSRASALFGNPTFLAGYLLMNVFVGLMIAYTEKDKRLKILALICSAISVFGIFLTQTMGDIGGLIIGLFLLAVYFAYYWSYKKTLLGIVAFAVLFGSAFLLTKNNSFWQNIPGVSRIATISLSSSNLQNRFIAWESGWEAFKERPLLGWGWENFNIGFNKYYNPKLLGSGPSETYWDKPHNVFLEYLYNGGIVGFLAFLSVLAVFFYQWRKLKDFSLIFLVFGMMAYLIQGLVVFDTFGVYLMLFLYLAFIDWNYKRVIANNANDIK